MENHPTSDDAPPSTDVVLELNFIPTWAREPPSANPYAGFQGERSPAARKRPSRRGLIADRGRWGGTPLPRPARRDAPRESLEGRAPRTVVVSFVPEKKHLGHLVHELRASGRAYPLADLAARFLRAPALHLVKLETRNDSAGGPAPLLYQCKSCHLVFRRQEDLSAHATALHLDTVFFREQQPGSPPEGNFNCVARCRLSGELLGPPNYHGYNERVQEVWRKRFSQMTLDEYRGHIETVRDPDLLEKWKQSVSTRTTFRFKDRPELPELTETEAAQIFTEQHLPGLVAAGRRFILAADLARQLTDPGLRAAVREAWNRESRYPQSLLLALRPALHHMGLFLFKTEGGQTFVTSIRPHPLDPHRAVKSIAEVLHYLRRHPGCTRRELVEKLRPGMAPDSPQAGMVLSPIRWLIEKGHVIEFFNGTLSVPGAPPVPARPAAPAP